MNVSFTLPLLYSLRNQPLSHECRTCVPYSQNGRCREKKKIILPLPGIELRVLGHPSLGLVAILAQRPAARVSGYLEANSTDTFMVSTSRETWMHDRVLPTVTNCRKQ
jgi:hypothetical protein